MYIIALRCIHTLTHIQLYRRNPLVKSYILCLTAEYNQILSCGYKAGSHVLNFMMKVYDCDPLQ